MITAESCDQFQFQKSCVFESQLDFPVDVIQQVFNVALSHTIIMQPLATLPSIQKLTLTGTPQQ